jgi:nucleoside-diphosphate-sugar epimerase
MSRYAVTGCAGFIGSHLTEALLDRGQEVVGVDSFTAYYARERKESNLSSVRDAAGFTLIEDDLSTRPLMPLISGVDGVFHLAGQPGVRESWGDGFTAYLRDNLQATQRVFQAAAECRVRVVFASSSSVYGDAESYPTHEDVRPLPLSPYGVTKLACEHLAQSYVAGMGLDVVCMRYFSVYGPRQRPDMAFQRLIAALLDGQPFPLLGTGRQVRDFTYVGDVVAATLSAMELGRPGCIYNVGGGSPTSLLGAIRICERVTGRRVILEREPAARGDARRTTADVSRIGSELGWRPQTPLPDGLAKQVAWAGRQLAASA